MISFFIPLHSSLTINRQNELETLFCDKKKKLRSLLTVETFNLKKYHECKDITSIQLNKILTDVFIRGFVCFFITQEIIDQF